MGGISFVLALCHSHPKLLLGGGAWLKGYIIPPCTLKTPCPIFPPSSTVEHTKVLYCSSWCWMDFSCLSSSRWLLIWKIKWMKASRWKANHIEIPSLLFHYGTPTWNGCSSQCNWTEAMFLYTFSIVVSFALSSLVFHWAVFKKSIGSDLTAVRSYIGDPIRTQYVLHCLCTSTSRLLKPLFKGVGGSQVLVVSVILASITAVSQQLYGKTLAPYLLLF